MSEGRVHRRELLRGLTAAVAASWMRAEPASASGGPTLNVFVPVLERAPAFQRLLASSFTGLELTVFGRFVDFKASLEQAPPDAALALGTSLEAVGVQPQLRGQLGGARTEGYALLRKRGSRNETVGVVDIVGRRALPSLVQRLLGSSSPPPLQRVVKVADLLPLLQVDLAGAVLLPERFVARMRATSELQLDVQPLGVQLPRVAVAFLREPQRARITRALQNLHAPLTAVLGVEGWS